MENRPNTLRMETMKPSIIRRAQCPICHRKYVSQNFADMCETMHEKRKLEVAP